MRWTCWCGLLALAGGPLAGQVLLESGLAERFSCAPGGVHRAEIDLFNPSELPLRVEVEALDVRTSCDSGYRYLPLGSVAEGLGNMLEVGTSDFVMAAGERRSVPVLVRVPGDFSAPAAYGALMVASTAEREDSAVGPRVQVRVRYAIHFIYRNPIAPVEALLAAQSLLVDSLAGEMVVRYRNDGLAERIVQGHAQLLDAEGAVRYVEASAPQSILPGQCRNLRFPLPSPGVDGVLVVRTETDAGEAFGVSTNWSGT